MGGPKKGLNAGAQVTKAPASIYQIKISLKGSRPLIWRRILVPSQITLGFLNLLIQKAFGWSGVHLHDFLIHGKYYGDPSSEPILGLEDEAEVTLGEMIPAAGSKLTYEYDFGDQWLHELRVEKVLLGSLESPCCIAGARACPPENCGGLTAYYQMLEVLRNPQAELYSQTRSWVGYDFDPNEFSLRSINYHLAEVSASRELDLTRGRMDSAQKRILLPRDPATDAPV